MRRAVQFKQSGASLIEVLVAILLLSFGMLALGAMLSFAVQAPKLSNNRAIASMFAAGHIERIRANPQGFAANAYTSALSYDGTFDTIALSDCTHPACNATSLATMDNAATNQAVRTALPAGGMMMKCDTPTTCTQDSYGNLWIVWQEPSTMAALNPTSSDNCPSEVTGIYTSPAPRCLYIRFKI